MDNDQVNVLIIDDSSNVKILTAILKPKGFNIRSVSSGELALSSAKENPPHIILLNINLPDIDGYEVCSNFKLNEDLKEIPIIFIVSCSDGFDSDSIFANQAADYITVPFHDKEVLSRLETHLKLYLVKKTNERLVRMNSDLQDKVREQTQQMEDITKELKEFNVMLDAEITQRTKTEEDLRESESQFRHSIEEAPVPVMLFADDGEIIKISKAWSDITGFTVKDISTTSQWAEIVPLFKKDSVIADNSKEFNLGERQNDGEYSIRTRNGDGRIWDFYTSYIGRLHDGRKLLFRMAIDITERKHMEELQKKIEEERQRVYALQEYDKVKTEFFANISHELRTPINVIFSALQMHELNVKDCPYKDASASCNKYTKLMKQNCYRLIRIANNLIDITKIDAGFFEINETNNNIVNLIENITMSVADYIESKGLSLVFDTDVEEKIIACDPEKIERIILNLLSNSVKFTPTGGKIMVNIKDGVKNICIRVKDTGIGIPADKLNYIFERFIQVDKSFTRDHEGSGIGLSLVKALVEMHGGTISAKSKVGHGTEIIIHLPCKLVDEAQNKNRYSNVIDENLISKINIEFSDIYQ